MNKVYITYHSIVSALGFDSETVAGQVANEVSALEKQEVPGFDVPVMTSLVPKDQLEAACKTHQMDPGHTTLEKMMLVALKQVIAQASLEINDRVGLIVATTKGNIDALDANSDFPKKRARLGVLGEELQKALDIQSTPMVLSNACVSGVMAVSVGKRLIANGTYDHVLVVGGDLVTPFILSGFRSFQALSDEKCKPYSKNRTGINIGEVAAAALLTNDSSLLTPTSAEIIGDANSNDANHISGPSRTGEGLYRCIQNSLQEANLKAEDIDFISAHGTATIFNDEMEAIAFNRAGMEHIPVNSYKGYFGHTLGASGLLESILGLHSMASGKLHRSLGFDAMGVTQPIAIIEKTREAKIHRFIKTASGFGGCNTAVIFEKV
ncbi:MAG: beta-ketoacyl synthase [Flavobacteriaceae bacterium]|nr:beta-ketoacyl synthase [Flavobacteriaceae bacterium]